jgi:hypothetical protein
MELVRKLPCRYVYLIRYRVNYRTASRNVLFASCEKYLSSPSVREDILPQCVKYIKDQVLSSDLTTTSYRPFHISLILVFFDMFNLVFGCMA